MRALMLLLTAAAASALEPLGASSARELAGDVLAAANATWYVFKEAGEEGLRVSQTLPTGTSELARMRYSDRVDETGWAFLALEANTESRAPEVDIAFASGYLEAYVTWERILQYALNTGSNGTQSAAVEGWLEKNGAFVRDGVKQHAAEDPFWHQVELLLAQEDGMAAGYAAAAPESKQLLRETFRNFNIGGDLEDLATAVKYQGGASSSPESSSLEHTTGPDSTGGRCSALVKKTEDDVFISQATWSSFNSMLRTYKRYVLPFRSSGAPSSPRVAKPSIWFSSYPGTLFSGDDWYTLAGSEEDPGMVVLETTIGNSNSSRWAYVVPETVLEWTRNVVANRLARDGASWCETFSRLNSGTYNNEFIVMDNSRISVPPSGPVKLGEGAIWMLDQIPGLIVSRDVTERLESEGYIPSYNSPGFEEIFIQSGDEALVRKYGQWFTYNRTARAEIFRRNQTHITGLDGMRGIMRYNDFKHDPISRMGQEGLSPPYSAENAISCRDDLNPADGTYNISALGHRNHAGTDAKLTSARMMRGEALATTGAGGETVRVGGQRFTSMIISGPTHQAPMPEFRFSTSSFDPVPAHEGMPDLFAFAWVPVVL